MDFLTVVTIILVLFGFLFLYRMNNSKLPREVEASEFQIKKVLSDPTASQEILCQSLSHLNSLAEKYQVARQDILCLVLNVMQAHKQKPDVLAEAIACLIHLKKYITSEILLQQIINTTLEAMENFPSHKLLQQNILYILDEQLINVPFDKWHCLKLLLNTLNTFEDDNEVFHSLVLTVCDDIFHLIPRQELDNLADTSDNWRKICINKSAVTEKEIILLRQTLAVLWNLSSLPSRNENIVVNETFLNSFVEVLETFKEDPVTTEGVLGILHNICCKTQFMRSFLKVSIIQLLQDMLLSPNQRVSFTTAKIFTKLCYFIPHELWPTEVTDREKILKLLQESIVSWKSADINLLEETEISFNCDLLANEQTELQLFAGWFIYNLGIEKSNLFLQLLQNEKCMSLIKEKASGDNDVARICTDILQLKCAS